MTFLDTHVVVWLYAGERERFPPSVVTRLESDDLVISPMVALELQFLREIERLRAEPCHMLDVLRETFGVQVDTSPFFPVILQSMEVTWTRDPFDRLIVAGALVHQAPLLTKDNRMRTHCPLAVWDGADGSQKWV